MVDHTLFKPDAIDPETANFNAELAELLAQAPAANEVPVEETRSAREEGRGIAGPVMLSDMADERVIQGPHGPITLRTFVPEQPRGVYLHIHGGGWVLGRAHLQDPRNEDIAQTCSAAIVSVDYRLAPEHPYPAPLDDCEAAAVWVVEHAKSEFGVDSIVIGGESAGGHLSATTILRMRDRHGYTGFSGANLVYGVYDLAMTPSQKNWGERPLVLSTPIMDWFYDHFVPAEIRRDPDVSPLYADLQDLPPALFTVGTLDPLLDDTLFMHQRWMAAGNESELRVYPGGPHGFDGHPTKLAETARHRMNEFIASHL
jgi:acetyl esterase/lipase